MRSFGERTFSTRLAGYASVFALAGLAFWHANVQPLWMDETYGLVFAQRSLPSLLQALAGPSAFAERWPSAACWLLTGIVVFRIGTLLAGRSAGVLAFVFWAIQPEGFWYGQEVRMYAPLSFWTALALLLLLRALAGDSRRDWFLFSLAELAALWTHYAGAFVVLLATVTVLAFGRRAMRLQPLAWVGWPALTYLPWLWYVRHIQPPTARPSGSLGDQALAVGRGLLLGYGGPLLPAALATLLILLLLTTLAFAALSGRRPLQLIACPVAVVTLAPLIIPPLHFLFSARYLSLVCPLLCVYWAVAIRELERYRRPLAVGLAAVVAGASLAGMAIVLAPTFRHWYDYPPALAFVQQHEQAGQILIDNSGVDPTARYYYQDVDHGALPLLLLPPYHPGSVPDVESTAFSLAQRYTGVWLPLDAAGTWDGDRVVQRAFDATLVPAGQWQFRDVPLRFYLTARGLAGQQPAETTFAGSIRLASFGTLRSGDQWFVAFHWLALRPMPRNFTVFVHVVDGSGTLVVQHDGPPDDGRLPTGTWTAGSNVYDLHRLTVPPSAPALHLVVGWYDPATNQRLAIAGGGDSVDLGPLP
ncbi:MAG TPA: glycosyltransferase family 39 protein [Chloroflexota bacterium]